MQQTLSSQSHHKVGFYAHFTDGETELWRIKTHQVTQLMPELGFTLKCSAEICVFSVHCSTKGYSSFFSQVSRLSLHMPNQPNVFQLTSSYCQDTSQSFLMNVAFALLGGRQRVQLTIKAQLKLFCLEDGFPDCFNLYQSFLSCPYKEHIK